MNERDATRITFNSLFVSRHERVNTMRVSFAKPICNDMRQRDERERIQRERDHDTSSRNVAKSSIA